MRPFSEWYLNYNVSTLCTSFFLKLQAPAGGRAADQTGQAVQGGYSDVQGAEHPGDQQDGKDGDQLQRPHFRRRPAPSGIKAV